MTPCRLTPNLARALSIFAASISTISPRQPNSCASTPELPPEAPDPISTNVRLGAPANLSRARVTPSSSFCDISLNRWLSKKAGYWSAKNSSRYSRRSKASTLPVKWPRHFVSRLAGPLVRRAACQDACNSSWSAVYPMARRNSSTSFRIKPSLAVRLAVSSWLRPIADASWEFAIRHDRPYRVSIAGEHRVEAGHARRR